MRKPLGLSARLFLAFALVALIGVGTVAVVANRVTARQFTLYVSQGGRMRAQRWAERVAAYYERTASWEGVETVFAEQAQGSESPHQPGQGRVDLEPPVSVASRVGLERNRSR